MEVELATLMSALGRAAQDAQSCMERQAVEDYYAYYRNSPSNGEAGPDQVETEDEGLTPLCRCFSLPDGASGKRQVDVPEAALARHESMFLDTVSISLNVQASIQGKDGTVLVEVGPGEKPGKNTSYSRLELTFRSTPAAEGIERVNQSTMKFL